MAGNKAWLDTWSVGGTQMQALCLRLRGIHVTESWTPPDGHPITEALARHLMASGYGEEMGRLTVSYCVPIFWSPATPPHGEILHNGTLTLVRTPKRLLGITAEHVIAQARADSSNQALQIQMADAVVPDLLERVIASSAELDLATIDIDDSILRAMHWPVSPMSLWPPKPPAKDRGVMLAGFPAASREIKRGGGIAWGPFYALGIARQIESDQVTWLLSREHLVQRPGTAPLPERLDLGGISGGPYVALRENASGLAVPRLAGIVSQAQNDFEYVVAKRADYIFDDGTIAQSRDLSW